jgi:short-subunit dehydrogenase
MPVYTLAGWPEKQARPGIAILGRRLDLLHKTKAWIETYCPETAVLAFPTDITKLERALDEIARVGPLEVLISNAGAGVLSKCPITAKGILC